MSDPQRPQVPPYASPSGQHPQPGHPTQPSVAAQPYYQSKPQQPAVPQGYVLNGQTADPSRPDSTGTNAPGRIGFIIGLVGLVLGLLMNVIVQITIRSVGFQIVSIFAGFGSLLVFLAAVAALVFGLVGLKRVGVPHGQAGIAVGLGIAGVAGGVLSFLISSLGALFY